METSFQRGLLPPLINMLEQDRISNDCKAIAASIIATLCWDPKVG